MSLPKVDEDLLLLLKLELFIILITFLLNYDEEMNCDVRCNQNGMSAESMFAII